MRLIEPVSFAAHRPPIEVLTLESLHARRPRDLTLPERPDFHLLLLATHGAGTHTVDFVTHRLSKGALMVVSAGQVQQFAPPGRLGARLVVFRPDAVRWRPLLPAPVVPLSPQRRGLVFALVNELERELSQSGGRSLTVAAQLLEALGAATVSSGPAPGREQLMVNRFRAELEKHHKKAHEVSAYAAILRCSTKTLTRHCLTYTGQAPKRLIDERVALEARRSLAFEDRSVAELSELLGFHSATQFVKFFRRVTKETPGAFRARLRR